MPRGMRKRLLAAAATAALVTAPHDAIAARQPVNKKQGAKAPDRPRRGRPRKFSRPSRAVTLTLPEDVIAALRAVDTDLSRAVVRIAPRTSAPRDPEPIEVAAYGEHAVIIVPRNRELAERIGIDLVPLSDGGALISFDRGLSASHLELRLGDALADPSLAPADRTLFEALADILRRARKADGLALRERSIIVLKLTKAGVQLDAADARSA